MQSQTPQLSIGLPVFNGEMYLAETLDSLLNQTYTDFEIIISDNGSTDKTEEICRAYCAKDSRLSYHKSDVNHGATWNYNRVFDLANGTYFKWAAADDLCEPQFLEKCMHVLETRPEVTLAFTKVKIIDAEGQFVSNYPSNFIFTSSEPKARLEQFLKARGLCNPIFGVMRKAELQSVGQIESYVASDKVLLAKLMLRGPFCEVPEHLFLRREHPQTSVSANRAYRLRLTWFDPRKSSRLQLPRWRWFYEYMRAIQKTPMRFSTKMSCYKVMGQHYLFHPGWMIKDFRIALQELRQS